MIGWCDHEPPRLKGALGIHYTSVDLTLLPPRAFQSQANLHGSAETITSSWAQAVNDMHLATARLLCQVAPVVMADNVFALKGGTAINLFLREMPRLSVDLDLAFPDRRPGRTKTLGTITDNKVPGAGIEPARSLRNPGF